MPFGLGWPELIIVLVIVLVIFGASRVPEVGRALGQGIKQLRGAVSDVKAEAEGKRDASAEEKEPSASEKSLG